MYEQGHVNFSRRWTHGDAITSNLAGLLPNLSGAHPDHEWKLETYLEVPHGVRMVLSRAIESRKGTQA